VKINRFETAIPRHVPCPRSKDQGGYGLTLPDLIVRLLGSFLLESAIRTVKMEDSFDAADAVTCESHFFSI
jgi:hypothetical protein